MIVVYSLHGCLCYFSVCNPLLASHDLRIKPIVTRPCQTCQRPCSLCPSHTGLLDVSKNILISGCVLTVLDHHSCLLSHFTEDFSFLKNYFIVIQVQLSAFTPHHSPHPNHPHLPPLLPPPLVLSMCPL